MKETGREFSDTGGCLDAFHNSENRFAESWGQLEGNAPVQIEKENVSQRRRRVK